MKKKKLKDKYPQYIIGDYSYGDLSITDWHDKKTFLSIGKFCSFAKGSQILMGGEHRTDWTTTYPFNILFEKCKHMTGHPTTKGDIIIKNDVLVCTGVTILSGVTIGNGAVIGAGAVVSGNVSDYSIVVGNPAKCIRKRFNYSTIKRLLEIKWWDWKYEKIVKNIHLLQGDVSCLIESKDL